MRPEKKLTSRKFWLATGMSLIATFILMLPSFLGTTDILSGSEYVSLLLGIFGIYTTGNVAETHVVAKSLPAMALEEVHLLTNKKPFLDGQALGRFKLK